MAQKHPPSDHPMIAWAVENIVRGCEENAMAKTMMDSGWSWRDAFQFLDSAKKSITSIPQKLPSPRPELSGYAGCPDGHLARVGMRVADPEIALVTNMIAPSERLDLIELGRARLTRSLTIDNDAAMGNQRHDSRSSDGAALHDISHPSVAAVRARASWMFNWPEENFEGLQILRYLPGQEYRAHHDWFDPATPGGASQLLRGGQRLATVVAYLNDCPKGGGTTIPALGVRTEPIGGNAIFFSYASDGSLFGDARLLHAGEPVLEGEKWVCTFWMRQSKFG